MDPSMPIRNLYVEEYMRTKSPECDFILFFQAVFAPGHSGYLAVTCSLHFSNNVFAQGFY